jgi:monoterpene epsilon-lactone hydrolase
MHRPSGATMPPGVWLSSAQLPGVMSSWQARAFSHVIRAIVRRRKWGRDQALASRARRTFGAPRAYGWLTTVGLTRTTYHRDGVDGEWLVPGNPRPGIIFYVHGGGFVSCSAATHRPIAAALARLTQRPVFSANYRLAPEVRLPAAHEDIAAAYASMIRTGVLPSQIALVGDSAGGNLVLRLAVQLRDRGAPTPACIAVFSPWTDLSGQSPSVQANVMRCAMFHPENIRDFAAAALGREPPGNPVVSPVYADLHSLPPVLLHVGSTELLLDDATRVHDRIRQSNGESFLHVYDDVPHCWQMLFPFVPEAIDSLGETATFIDAALEGALGKWSGPVTGEGKRPTTPGRRTSNGN